MDGEQDPILAYLLDFNKTTPIQYRDRHLIPPGGLQEMLTGYKKFHLSREGEEEPKQKTLSAEEELYKLLD